MPTPTPNPDAVRPFEHLLLLPLLSGRAVTRSVFVYATIATRHSPFVHVSIIQFRGLSTEKYVENSSKQTSFGMNYQFIIRNSGGYIQLTQSTVP